MAAASRRLRLYFSPLSARPFTRELLIFLGFVLITSLMTWPWVTRLKDAVVDPGDPYLVSWILWWDYHQTFNDPLHLFNANIFYPLPYTLAFSENDYGIALLFFPLFALGFSPLTINSVATFLGFAFSGYGAFRLTRTLTHSNTAAWVAGLVFAFIPYRFHLLSQLHYVFTGWMPLMLEALVLFARERSRKRAAWLGVAFTMNALSCVTWFILSLTPLAFSALFLVLRYRFARDRDFWVRGAAVAVASVLALLPFLLPYHYVSQAYNFTWSRAVVEKNSATPLHWLVAEYRNHFWKGFGDNLAAGGNYRLFPGLLPLLLSLAAVLIPGARNRPQTFAETEEAGASGAAGTVGGNSVGKRVARLDTLAVAAATVAFVSAGWGGSKAHPLLASIFGVVTADRALLVLAAALLVRLSLAYPQFLSRATGAGNLIENIRSSPRGEAFWLGAIWAVTGFLMSLGMNSWLYRVHYDLVFLFRSMREPSRAAMVACLGLAVLAGLGAAKLAGEAARLRPRRGAVAAVALITLALLFELRAAPLRFMRGASRPDEITLRLKETPMRGGLVEFPTGGGTLPHLYMLRSADHTRPLINAISTFVPQHSWEIDSMSHESPIPPRLLDALENVPTSYLVIHNPLIEASRRPVYEAFLIRAVNSGRLRFIRRFGEGDDLYAVVKTEPEAQSEAPLPFDASYREWADMVEEDTVNLLAPMDRSTELYRVHLVATGEMPRYDEFVADAKTVGRGVFVGFEEETRQFQEGLRKFTEAMVNGSAFRQKYGGLDDAQYVERLLANAGLAVGAEERDALTGDLKEGRETRTSVLLKIAYDPRLANQERDRALVLLHFFAYLRRNPGDPPDANMDGFLHWVGEAKKHDAAYLTEAFSNSIERQALSGPSR
ncbi:MAG: hypothetical protein LC802_19575 [Acidobacteria bacterium]|nr:hypothetical protein [Acidobacteriota bacterium]